MLKKAGAVQFTNETFSVIRLHFNKYCVLLPIAYFIMNTTEKKMLNCS